MRSGTRLLSGETSALKCSRSCQARDLLTIRLGQETVHSQGRSGLASFRGDQRSARQLSGEGSDLSTVELSQGRADCQVSPVTCPLSGEVKDLSTVQGWSVVCPQSSEFRDLPEVR